MHAVASSAGAQEAQQSPPAGAQTPSTPPQRRAMTTGALKSSLQASMQRSAASRVSAPDQQWSFGSAIDVHQIGAIVNAARNNERVWNLKNVHRDTERPGNMGYTHEPADPVWSTSPYDLVGGWADVEEMHTEPGRDDGWASLAIDEQGIPVREWRTATPGAVVSLGSHLDATTGIDALERLSLAATANSRPTSSSRATTPTSGFPTTDLLVGYPVGISTAMAGRLESRTFSPWKPLKVTVPDEPEPEPEPLVDRIYKMRRFQKVATRHVQKVIYVSVIGKDSADGSISHPVQTTDRARELMKSQGATKVMLIPDDDGPVTLLLDSSAVPLVPSTEIDESARDPRAPESPCFLSKFPPGQAQELPPLRDPPAQSLDSTIKNLELQTAHEQALVDDATSDSVTSGWLANWSPPRCVAAQLLDTRAVLNSPPATSVTHSSRAEPRAHLPPTPPSAAKPRSAARRSPASRSRVVKPYSPDQIENVDMWREAAIVAKIAAETATRKSRGAVYGLQLASQAELKRDLERYRVLMASPGQAQLLRQHRKEVSIDPASIDAVRPDSAMGAAPNPAASTKLEVTRGAMSVGVAVDKDGKLHAAPLQRHALEIAMADELPQRMSADDGIVPPSAYAVLYWNGTLIGQTQVVHSHRSPRWRHTFELAHIKTEKEEGQNSLEVEVWALPADSQSAADGVTPTPPGTPGSTERPDSAGSSKLGGNKKLLGKTAWKGKPGEFPEGMLVLALTAPKSTFFRSLPKPAHISASVESVESGTSTESGSKPVTSGPRLTIKLIERPAVHTIRRETMEQHENAKGTFKMEMEAMMQRIDEANAEIEAEKAQARLQQLYEESLADILEEMVTGAAHNAAVERHHQRKRARWHASVKRAVQHVTEQSIEWATMQLMLGLNKGNAEQADSAAAKLQAVQRGKIGRAKAARVKIESELGLTGSEEEAAQIAKMQATVRGKQDRKKVAELKAEKIESELGLTGSEEEAAQIAKMQAAARGKIARQELAEQQQAATKIAAVHRGNQDRARLSPGGSA